MRIAYLDCFSGISGDMFLGALVDAGVSAQLLERTVAALNIGARLEISRVQRNAISATKVDVYFRGEKDLPRDLYWQQHAERSGQSTHVHGSSEHPHDHAHANATQPVALLEHNYGLQVPAALRERVASPEHIETRRSADSALPHQHERDHSHPHEPGRGLREIRNVISNAGISEVA